MRSLWNYSQEKEWAAAYSAAERILRLISFKLVADHIPQVFVDSQKGRFVSKQIFCGSGEHSAAQCGLLHLLLDRGLDALSGYQQLGGHSGPDIDVDAEAREAQKCLRDTVKDISMALLGR